jgi:hypothetical protein
MEDFMKKRLFSGFIFIVLIFYTFALSSCMSLGSIMSNSAPLRWTVGQYTNEWGDKLGKYFVEYDGNVTASLTNAGGTQDISISEITFSHHVGLSFRTTSFTAPISTREVNVIIKNTDGSESNFMGVWGTATRPYVVVSLSVDLLNALSVNDAIIRVSSQTSRFQFVFPNRFSDAYEKLQEREKK